ncbi:Multidrug export protein MepA [Enhygromyxa salina]|uniref:Multidrug export protein MepA n=1 Tax=Enhygromyxa salina TaxID=215803 RepID=A0A2S9Y7M7_9BACT|nr:MATE family efflux transporter [Enhygromyxa salina]PRQ01031.1 Multidrug export protein MepA [Enhygromyxa salina]
MSTPGAPKPPRATLVEGDIRSALVSLALPMSLGIVFLIALNLVDTYYVGQLGTDELAAISFTFPVIMLVMSATMGLGVGTTSAIARAIGGGDERKIRRLTTHALILGVLVVALLSGLGLVTQRLLFASLGAEGPILALVVEYMTIWFLGAAFLVIPMMGSGAIRATGDAKTPMYIMMVAAIVNGLLDPLLIFGLGPVPALGLRGAALATLAARLLTFVGALWVLGKRLNMIEMHTPKLAELRESWRSILSVGVPAALTNMLAPIATGVMTALIATHGNAAVAAWGVGSRLEGLVLIAPMALSAALTPFVGQNWGALRRDRTAEALRQSRRFVLLWGAGAWLFLITLGDFVASAFSDDPEVHEVLRLFFWVIPVTYGAHALVSVVSATFNAIDRAIRSTLLSATRSLLLAIPLALVGSYLADTLGIFIGVALATAITAVIANLWAGELYDPADHPDEDADEGVEPAAAPRASQSMRGVSPGRCALIDGLVAGLCELDQLRVAKTRGNAIGFFGPGGHEIGHVHRGGQLDLCFPPAIMDQLAREGVVEHHRHIDDACWVTHELDGEDDLPPALALLRLGYQLARLHALVDLGAELSLDEALRDLTVSEALRAEIEALVDSWSPRTPRAG